MLSILVLFVGICLALPENLNTRSSSPANNSSQINSNSVLVALLDSHYTKLAKLVEKALLLQTLEETVGKHNITIFAPRNEALERDLDPEFKRFLLKLGNLKLLQKLLMFHIIPTRIGSNQWPTLPESTQLHRTLSHDHLFLTHHDETGDKTVDHTMLIHPDFLT
ncbi:fasciclin-like arabinogalactan protein 17 [Castanea sativa]|uniref:fasciclin-like arabinogalactan protein 17 n=1 Tax=Castanea sativa TaxID=21020 RepID=UPI003F64A7DA